MEWNDEGEDYAIEIARPARPGTRGKGPKAYKETTKTQGVFCQAHFNSNSIAKYSLLHPSPL